MEEKGESSWLAISAYGKYDTQTNEAYKNCQIYHNDEKVIYTVRLSDVEHIEIF